MSGLLKPLNTLARIRSHSLREGIEANPESLTLKIADANNTLFERNTREYRQPAFGIPQIKVGAKEYSISEEIVWEKPFCTLRHFRKEGSLRQEKMLVIAPLSGHYATLLRDTVKGTLSEYDVYISDWQNARDIPLHEGDFSLDDYIAYIIEWLTFFKGDIHILAVCQPTVPVAAAVALLEQQRSPHIPKTMILMGGPIDTRINPLVVNAFAKKHSLDWFRRHALSIVPPPYPGAGRVVCPGFIMLSGFISLDPSRHFDSHLSFYADLVQGSGEKISTHTKFYDEYLSVLDLPGTYFIDCIDKIFQRHTLPDKQFFWHDIQVDLKAIKRVPILTIEGELDIISPPGQTSVIHDLTHNLPSALKQHLLQPNVGHYGIFSGRTWRGPILQKIINFTKKTGKKFRSQRLGRKNLPNNQLKGQKNLEKNSFSSGI